MNKIIAWFITFNFINITWVFFRADNFTSAINLIKNMFNLYTIELLTKENLLMHINSKPKIFVFIFLAILLVTTLKNSNSFIDKFKPNKLYLFSFLLMFLIATLNLNKYQIFLYFNF